MKLKYFAVLFTLAVTASVILFAEAEPPTYNSSISWASKYVSEGRDNLEDGGLFTAGVCSEWNGFTGGICYSYADTVTYDELGIHIEYGREVGALEVYGGYCHLEFFEDDEHDNELYAGTSISAIPYLSPSIEYVYSTGAEGGFLTVSLCSEFELADGKYIFSPYIAQCFDFGYASMEYDGPNHFEAGVEVSAELTNHVCIHGILCHCCAHRDVRNEGGENLTWGSVGIYTSF